MSLPLFAHFVMLTPSQNVHWVPVFLMQTCLGKHDFACLMERRNLHGAVCYLLIVVTNWIATQATLVRNDADLPVFCHHEPNVSWV